MNNINLNQQIEDITKGINKKAKEILILQEWIKDKQKEIKNKNHEIDKMLKELNGLKKLLKKGKI